jgi:hypothetical protein
LLAGTQDRALTKAFVLIKDAKLRRSFVCLA